MILAATVDYSAAQAWNDLSQIAPIAAVTVTLLVAIVLDLLLPEPASRRIVALACATGLFVAIGMAVNFWLGGGGHSAYFGFATGDHFALFFEVLFAVLGVLTICISHSYLRRRGLLEAEFHVLTLAAVIGMMVLASATSLVSVFLGLELLSIALYIASGYVRSSTASQEAGAKYLLVGGFASAFVLYGMALTYGATGSTLLPEIARRVTVDSAGNTLLLLGILLMGVGFAFKVSAAPFHMWTPDVYQGAPTPVTAFMSVGTKAAAFAMIIRVFSAGLPHLAGEWLWLLAFVAAASMVVGNLMAIVQDSVKRLLAYSGVAQAGYILVGVLAGGKLGIGAVLFYLFAYLFMNFGAFAVLSALTTPAGEADRLADLQGLAYRHPFLGILMTVFMLSLAGFPPLAGFFGKLFLFTAAISAGWTWLVVLAVLMSVVSVYYYLRVVVSVWTPVVQPQRLPSLPGPLVAIGISGLLAILLGLYPSLLLGLGILAGGTALAAGP